MTQFPFAAIVGADDLALALLLTTIDPAVGGVLVRGEKGTAKSTIVRALVDILPGQGVVVGCRFGCDPQRADPSCPDGPHPGDAPSASRPARLVELPVGATEDRVVGSLDLGKALGSGATAFQPGLLAAAHRGILYVDEVNLLHDHLVDLLLDAAAMGRNTVERDGMSVSHDARIVLVGTMNPEEGELRPQLLDRFGLTVEVAASRDPLVRAEVIRRRLAFDTDPDGFAGRYAAAQATLTARLRAARDRLGAVALTDWAVATIARVCAGFDVDGMRADIVTARAAIAHAAWAGRAQVTRADIRAAARFALPHRRRRNPFDAPGLDEALLDRLLDEQPEPPEPADPEPADPEPEPEPADPAGAELPPSPERPERGDPEPGPGPAHDEARSPHQPDATHDPAAADHPVDPDPTPEGRPAPAPAGLAGVQAPFRARLLTVAGVGEGAAGRRSRAITSSGHTIGARPGDSGRVHLPATITAAARHQGSRGRAPGDPVRLTATDLRRAIQQGQEANLVLLAVDASGSMGARRRMAEVKTAVLSLLLDAYQRRDRVGLVTFGGHRAELALHPTSSVEAAARSLTTLPHGGRTPLAEGLMLAARIVGLERIRDPRRRALLVLLTDGRATAGPDALARARRIADAWPASGIPAVVIDCESGRFRLGLAGDLAARMGADHVPLEQVAASSIVDTVSSVRQAWRAGPGRRVA